MMTIRRLRGRMVRRHRPVRLIEPGEFATSHGRYACACEAYCAGWNDCYGEHALARVARHPAAQAPSERIAVIAADLGITDHDDCELCDETRGHVHETRTVLTAKCVCGHGGREHWDLGGPRFCEADDCKCEHYRPPKAGLPSLPWRTTLCGD